MQNNESEEQAAQRISQIYDRVQRQVYIFLTAMLIAIVLTSLYLIRSNRMLFARLAELSRAAQRSGAKADCDAGIHSAAHFAGTA